MALNKLRQVPGSDSESIEKIIERFNRHTHDSNNSQNVDSSLEFIGALYYKSSDQINLSTSANVLCQFDTEVYDIGSNFNTGTFLFTAPVAGYYHIQGLITYSTNAIQDKLFRYRVFINGTGGTLIQENFNQTAITASISVGGSIIYHLSVNDTVGFYVFHATGSNNVSMEGGAVYKSYGNIRLIAKD